MRATRHATEAVPGQGGHAEFGSSRAGARNVAGVHYQALATCFLLLDAEKMGVTKVRPEGDEDCDVFLTDEGGAESVLRVQIKFRSAKLSIPELAAALVKAWESSHSAEPLRRRIAVCTNHPLLTDQPNAVGLQPVLRGQNGRINDDSENLWISQLTVAIDGAAASRGLHFRARDILESAYFVNFSSDPNDLATEIGNRRSFHTALHAHLAAGRLLSSVLAATTANRSATPETAAIVSVHDVEEIIQQTVEATGSWLNDIEARQLVAPPAFSRRPAETRADYLRGLRAQPQHVGAGYAVRRPRWIRQVDDVLRSGSSALIVGPSGCGKSTLMWLAAIQHRATRVLVLNQVQIADVPQLATFLRLMAPSDSLPLLICADDVDRPALAGWSELLRTVGSDSRLRLVGTCREEFFEPGFTASGVARVVRPQLEVDEAKTLGGDLGRDSAGPLTERDLELIHQDSRGLMMEFVCIATTSRRLSDVLNEQASRLLSGRSAALLAIARTVLVADVCGITLQIVELRKLGLSDDDIAASLAGLHAEHILVEEGNLVRGLHPVRSRHLVDALHQTLPRLAETLATLIGLVPSNRLRTVVETWYSLDAKDEHLLERALAARIESDQNLDVPMVAELLARAEASSYAAHVHQQLDSSHGDIAPALLLGRAGSREYGLRLLTAGVWDSPLGGRFMSEALSKLQRFNELYDKLPAPRPVRRNVVEALGERSNWLIDGLKRYHRALDMFVGSNAFNNDQISEIMRFSIQVSTDSKMVPGLVYRSGATASKVRAQNNLLAAANFGAAARTGEGGEDAARRLLGDDPATRARWMLDKGAVLISVSVESPIAQDSGVSLRATLLAPALDVANSEFQFHFGDILSDAALVAGASHLEAEIVTAQNVAVPASVSEAKLFAWADRPSDAVMSIFLEQYQNQSVETSWFGWLDMVGNRLFGLAAALQLSANAYIETLRGNVNSRTLLQLQNALNAANDLLMIPLAAPPGTGGRGAAAELEEHTSGMFNAATSLEALHGTLIFVHGVAAMAFEELVGVADEYKLSWFDKVADLPSGLLTELQIFFEAFRGSTAHEALHQVLQGLEALQAIASCDGPGLDSLKLKLGFISSNKGSPERTVVRIATAAEAFRQLSRERERPGLLAGIQDLGPDWDLVSIPVRRGLHRPPLFAWAIVTPALQEVPMLAVNKIVSRVGGLEERVFVVVRTVSGDWHRESFAYAGPGVWRPQAMVPHRLVVHQLRSLGFDLDAKYVKDGTVEEELEMLLNLFSRRQVQAHILGQHVLGEGDWVRDLKTLASQVPASAYDAYASLTDAVIGEAEGSRVGNTLADEMDRYRLGEGLGPLLRTLQGAELDARRGTGGAG